jgi:hypothetical protein
MVTEGEGMCNVLNDFLHLFLLKRGKMKNYRKWRQGLVKKVVAS